MADEVRIGARLRELREQANLTREELAARCGISARAIVQWERDEREPGWSNVVALAQALGVTCEAFTVAATTTEVKGPGRPKKAEPEPAPPVKPVKGSAAKGKVKKGGTT